MQNGIKNLKKAIIIAVVMSFQTVNTFLYKLRTIWYTKIVSRLSIRQIMWLITYPLVSRKD